MRFYSVSDIHGERRALQNALMEIDLSIPENKLILLGDYIDYGNSSCQVLYDIYHLTQKYPAQIIKGNHEEMFLDWLSGKWDLDYLSGDNNLITIKTFLLEEQIKKLPGIVDGSDMAEVNYFILECIVFIRILSLAIFLPRQFVVMKTFMRFIGTRKAITILTEMSM